MTSAAPPPVARPFAVLAAVLPASFMQVVDVSIVNVAIPSIQHQLGASYTEVQLVLACYQLAYACVLITAARLGDIFGRKRLFLVGLAGFIVASILCGAAPGPRFLVAARTLQGVGAGLMMPQVLAVIQVAFPPEERGKAFGWYGLTLGLASITGPLLGGALIVVSPFGLDWRTIFFVNVPIGAAAMVAAARALPESRAPAAPALDLPGAGLVTIGLFLLMVPLTEAHEHGLPPRAIAMLAAAALVLAAFWALQERKSARDESPLLHTGLLRDRAFRRGLALAALLSFAIPSFFFVNAQYLQIGHDFTPLLAGLTTLPFAAAFGAASLVTDRLVKRFGLVTAQIGYLVLGGGFLAMRVAVVRLGVDMTATHLLVFFFAIGLGFGLVYAPLTSAILDRAEVRQIGAASGVLATGHLVGGALGVAIVGGVFAARLPASASAAPVGDPARELGFAAATADSLYLQIAVCAVCFLLFFALRRARGRPAE